MSQKPLKRKYHMSDGTLLETSGRISYAGTRDLADLATYGVTAATMQDIDDKAAAFLAHPMDEYYAGLLMEAVEERNEAVFALSEVAESVVRRGEIVWGKGSTDVKKFGFEGYSKKSPPEKVIACKNVHKVGTDFLSALSTAGLTITVLDDLNDKIQAAIGAIGLKTIRVAERDAGTQTRITLGNALYDACVVLADTGKSLYENTDEAKYNDYVITISSTPVQVATGTASAQMVIEPSVTVDSASDTIKVKNLGTKPLNVYFGDDPTDLPQGPYATVPAAVGGNEMTFNAADIGYTTTMNRLLLYNPDTVDSVEYEVRVS